MGALGDLLSGAVNVAPHALSGYGRGLAGGQQARIVTEREKQARVYQQQQLKLQQETLRSQQEQWKLTRDFQERMQRLELDAKEAMQIRERLSDPKYLAPAQAAAPDNALLVPQLERLGALQPEQALPFGRITPPTPAQPSPYGPQPEHLEQLPPALLGIVPQGTPAQPGGITGIPEFQPSVDEAAKLDLLRAQAEAARGLAGTRAEQSRFLSDTYATRIKKALAEGRIADAQADAAEIKPVLDAQKIDFQQWLATEVLGVRGRGLDIQQQRADQERARLDLQKMQWQRQFDENVRQFGITSAIQRFNADTAREAAGTSGAEIKALRVLLMQQQLDRGARPRLPVEKQKVVDKIQSSLFPPGLLAPYMINPAERKKKIEALYKIYGSEGIDTGFVDALVEMWGAEAGEPGPPSTRAGAGAPPRAQGLAGRGAALAEPARSPGARGALGATSALDPPLSPAEFTAAAALVAAGEGAIKRKTRSYGSDARSREMKDRMLAAVAEIRRRRQKR